MKTRKKTYYSDEKDEGVVRDRCKLWTSEWDIESKGRIPKKERVSPVISKKEAYNYEKSIPHLFKTRDRTPMLF